MTTPLVGRTGELELLLGAVEGITNGRGAIVHLVGDAGVGKSSLLGETSAALRAAGVVVLEACAVETARHRSGALARQLLPGLTRVVEDTSAAAVGIVEQLTVAAPLAVVVDDLHWADDASVEALRAVARRAHRLGVLLVTAGRSQPRPRELLRFEDVVDHLVAVPELDEEQLVALASRRLGGPPGRHLRTLLRSTDGNPFLASELLAGVAVARVDGTFDIDPAGGLLRADVVRRLADRTISAVDGGGLLLRALAVIPGGATADELAEVLGRPTGELVDVLLHAVDAAVLVDNGSTLTFRHELLRRCVAEATPPSLARSLARLAGDVLRVRRVDPDRLAACLLAGADADDAGDTERLLAVGREVRVSHPGAAADLLEAAAHRLAPHDERLPALTLERGWALVAAGRAGEVDAMLRERIGAFSDAEPIAFHRLRGVAASLTGHVDVLAERYADADIDWLVERYDPDDPEVVDAAAELAMLRISSGRPREALELTDWIDASPTPASAFREATVAVVRSQVATVAGRFEDAAATARQAAVWAARDHTRRASGATPALALAVATDLLGDGSAALEVVRGQGSVGTPRWGPPLMQFFASLVLFRRGDWDDALAEVDAGLVAADEVDLRMGVFWPDAVASMVATARGRVGEAQEWLARARESGTDRQLGAEWLVYTAVLREEAVGNVGGAVGLVELLVAKAVAAGAPAVLLNGGVDMSRLALDRGRVDLAKSIDAELEAMGARTASPVVAGAARATRSLLDEDPAGVLDAAAVLDGVGRRPEAARARHAAALLAGRHGATAVAREAALAAIAGYEALEANGWRRQLLAGLAAVGIDLRPRRRPARPSTGWASLTDSEARIVELVGEGLTNTAIGERLYVSRRTVESHLGRVYTKLGLRSRAELIAAAARR